MEKNRLKLIKELSKIDIKLREWFPKRPRKKLLPFVKIKSPIDNDNVSIIELSKKNGNWYQVTPTIDGKTFSNIEKAEIAIDKTMKRQKQYNTKNNKNEKFEYIIIEFKQYVNHKDVPFFVTYARHLR